MTSISNPDPLTDHPAVVQMQCPRCSHTDELLIPVRLRTVRNSEPFVGLVAYVDHDEWEVPQRFWDHMLNEHGPGSS